MNPRNRTNPRPTLLVTLLLAVLLILDGCTSERNESGMQRRPLLGVHIAETGSPDAYAERLERAASLGTRVIRIPVDWAQLEPNPGAFDADYLTELRHRLDTVERLDMSAVMLFAQSPDWANGGRGPAYPPLAAYRDHFGNALMRLIEALHAHAGHILAWEVWNEPNSIEFWPDSPEPRNGTHVLVPLDAATAYAALLETAYDRVKARFPEVTILGGALASADVDYLRALLDDWTDRALPMDALSVHPYSRVDERPGPHYGLAQYPEQCNDDDPLSPPWCFADGLSQLRNLLNERSLPDVSIWITEFGVASGAHWGEAGSESEQARHLRLAVEWLNRHSGREALNIPVALWYRLIDEQAELEAGDRFGLYRENGTEKPSARAFADLARR